MKELPGYLVSPLYEEIPEYLWEAKLSLAMPEFLDPAENILVCVDTKWHKSGDIARFDRGLLSQAFLASETVGAAVIAPRLQYPQFNPSPQGLVGPTASSYASCHTGATGATGATVQKNYHVFIDRSIPGHSSFKLVAKHSKKDGFHIAIDCSGQGIGLRIIAAILNNELCYLSNHKFVSQPCEGMTTANRLCHEVMQKEVISYGAPHYCDVVGDRFWQRFIDDIAGFDVISGVLLT